MPDQERIMLVFGSLAAESRQKSQPQGEVRFLLLTGIAAVRGGWSEVARFCRSRVLALNPAHLIGNHATMEDALRSDEFGPFVTHLERFCSFERGEMLLKDLHPDWDAGISEPGFSAGERVLAWLQRDA